jgi:formylglycine-generating enzyme required for sulfatase activity/glycerophosphoryl diester phosphodiesterase
MASRLLWLPILLALVGVLPPLAGTARAETLLLAKWDDPGSVDATYSLRGSVAFNTLDRLSDHAIGPDSPKGRPHTRNVQGRWGGGLCCKDARNADTHGNGGEVSMICAGWFSMENNFNLDEGTIEFYFKPDWEPNQAQTPHILFSTGSYVGPGTGNQSLFAIMWYWHKTGDGRLQAAWIGPGGADPPYIILAEHDLADGDLARDTWHHLAIAWNRTRAGFFVDGEPANIPIEASPSLRRPPIGTGYIMGGQDNYLHIYESWFPANGTYDNFRVSDTMLYEPDKPFDLPSDFPVPQAPAEVDLDLGAGVMMKMVLVQPGEFVIGSAKGGASEKPVRPVRIDKPFYIGKYEVTQAQWRAVMRTDPDRNDDPDSPVRNVSFDDCRHFLRRLRDITGNSSLRLPTEAEWEYACRAGSRGHYSFGDDPQALADYAWFEGNSAGAPHTVGGKDPNAWGIHDMHGNVREWCHDPFAADYSALDLVDPVARGCGAELGHALRGGAWSDDQAACRSAARTGALPSQSRPDAGLRCVIGLTVWDSPTQSPIVKPLHILAHRGGGRTYAPDNSMPNMEHAMTLGLTGVEIDLRQTRDGKLVLWHDDEIGDHVYVDGGGKPAKTKLSRMELQQVKALRYKGWVGDRMRELRIVPADEAIAKFKGQTNFYLDVKNTPAERILELIARHDVAERCIVLAMDMGYLRKIRTDDPRITLCYWAGIPDDPAEARELMEQVASLGVEIFGGPGLTEAKVRLCHEYGITARPSGGDVLHSDARRFLMMGVDGVIPDNPEAVLHAVERLWGKQYLPRPGQTIRDLLKGRKRR